MNERILDHVGIAVESLDGAVPIWTSIVGSPAYGRETVEGQGVEVVFIGTGPGRVELVAPTRSDSPVARFIERHGPGLHHVCYTVPDLMVALADHSAAGFQLIDPRPRSGAHGSTVAFLHPRSSGGVLIELLQTPGS
jgi:methylmalonyl-CoA/ethylmalonyl-CoA epimerase